MCIRDRCVSAYGKFSDSVTVTNHISTGDINISMKELEKKNGKEILYQNQKMVPVSYTHLDVYKRQGNGSTSRSAVSTADNSPIGTMSALAVASLLAGGYVIVRRRKKDI